ncbi:hypothetical protein M0805_007223 [Coniferiporia weirii]|nr:hypothetical protein M0805_007223 [Coniferiporia weirii]
MAFRLPGPQSGLESGFTPSKVADSEQLNGIKLSPDASKVLYTVNPAYKSGEHNTSAIWLADVDTAGSAKQFTSGLFNDTAAQFHPDGQRVIFLSDRHKAGAPLQVYSINIAGGEASPLFGKDNKKKVSMFELSPNGLYLAFTSADEPTPEDKQREKDKDDAMVFGDKRAFERLRLYTFASGTVRTLDVPKNKHVFHFTWTPDSKEIIFAVWRQTEAEFSEEETPLQRIGISVGSSAQVIGAYPRTPLRICPMPDGVIVDIQRVAPASLSDSRSIFVHSADDFARTTQLYGEVDCAAYVKDIKGDGLIAVDIATGLDTRIDVLDVRGSEPKILFTLYKTSDEAIGFIALWDVRCRADGAIVLAVIKSSAVKKESPNVWTGVTNDRTKACKLETKLSSHLQWMADVPTLHTEAFYWDAEDGTKLDGTIVFPPGKTGSKPDNPLPTVMLVHGGPYWRVTLGYEPHFAFWEFLLASRGYLVISPNFRGGQGHGSEFARAAHGGMGTLDWSDCASMLDAAIGRGFADPSRLGIGGWSFGGFMTAWGVTATKNRFKAGVMGAGISDWGQMAAESDLPGSVADVGGCAPWDTPVLTERVDLNGSPIGRVADVESAVLVMHGEKDQRVPAAQGISFFRGLRRRSKYPERAQLVIYPREPHVFTEKKHAEDVMKRVIEHFDLWL